MFKFFQPATAEIQLFDYWVHIAEVSVQFIAVILLFIAVRLAGKANETANAALVESKRDLAAERAEYAAAMTKERYDVLDRTYMELVLLRIDHPEFSDPAQLYMVDPLDAGSKVRRGYESYAFALFNYLETIADKCHDEINDAGSGEGEKVPDLVETWAPILVSESWQHRHWFQSSESNVDDRFKDQFRRLVATVVATKDRDPDAKIDPVTLIRSSYA